MKDRTLNIGFDYGEMSIAGKLTATQFRDWALNRLAEIIGKIRDFEQEPSKYVKTRKFIAVKELAKYQAAQKEQITKLLALLLELKINPGTGSRVIDQSPLEIARDMKNLVHVQFRVTCQEENCSQEGYLTCPRCGGTFFDVLEVDGKWALECATEKRNAWSSRLPIETRCEQEHPLRISARDLEGWIEILPGRELLDILSDIVSSYIPGSVFDGDIEYFLIHGRHMIYYVDSGDMSSIDPGTNITVNNIRTGNVSDSEIIMGSGNFIIKEKKKQVNRQEKVKRAHKKRSVLPALA